MVKPGTLLLTGLLLACLALTGCMRDYPAPVVERSIIIAKRAPLEPPGSYVVERGDTLYSVAFRFGVDVKRLARWNDLVPPYTIYPGQRLAFSATDSSVRVTTAGTPEAASGAVEIEPLPPPEDAVAQAEPEPEPLPESPPEPARIPRQVSAAGAPGDSVEVAVAEPGIGGGEPQWRWPAEGTLLSTFEAGNSSRNGIDIAGEPGQPVLAAAAGTVVYSGSGLIGYGELIIIKHNDGFLSAYGHNRERMVSQGETVTAGQQIAELGASGAPRPMLHFEIRVAGDPVDPLKHLPQR